MYKSYKIDIDETLEWSIQHGGCLKDLLIKKAKEKNNLLEFDGVMTILIEGTDFVVVFENLR